MATPERLSQRPRGRGAVVAVTLAAAVVFAPALAAEWDVVPRAELGVIYSDNIGLDPSGEEQDELVIQAAPGLAIRRDDERVQAEIDYRLQYLEYTEDSEGSQIFHELQAELSADVMRDRLFVDFSGAVYQQVVDPEERTTQSNLPLTGNRSDAKEFDVAPYLRQPLGGSGELLMRYGYGRIYYDDDSLQDAEIQSGLVEVASRPEQLGTTWKFSYRQVRQEFDVSSDARYAEARAEIGNWITGNLRLFGAFGAESDFKSERDSADLDSDFWDIGLNWKVAERDDLLLSYSDRVYGSSYKVRWLHKLNALNVRVSYSEDPSTNAGARLGRLDDPAPGAEIGLDRAADADVFLRRRFQGGISIDRVRTQLSIDGYYEKRSDFISEDGEPDSDRGNEQARGVGISWRWRPAARTDFVIQYDWERNEFEDGREFDLNRGRAGIDYDLGLQTRLSLRYEVAKRAADERDNYTENQVGLYLERTF